MFSCSNENPAWHWDRCVPPPMPAELSFVTDWPLWGNRVLSFWMPLRVFFNPNPALVFGTGTYAGRQKQPSSSRESARLAKERLAGSMSAMGNFAGFWMKLTHACGGISVDRFY